MEKKTSIDVIETLALVVTVVGALVFLAMAAAVLVPIGMIVLSPFVAFFGLSVLHSLLFGKEEQVGVPGPGRAAWNQVPARLKIESLMERLSTPAAITHKDSTEVVFANSKVENLLGVTLLGHSVEEDGKRFRPVRVNGAKVSDTNHPALLLRRAMSPLLLAEVVFSTPKGAVPVELRARKLFAAPEELGDFLLYTMQPQWSS